jgi:hypothetical protein
MARRSLLLLLLLVAAAALLLSPSPTAAASHRLLALKRQKSDVSRAAKHANDGTVGTKTFRSVAGTDDRRRRRILFLADEAPLQNRTHLATPEQEAAGVRQAISRGGRHTGGTGHGGGGGAAATAVTEGE